MKTSYILFCGRRKIYTLVWCTLVISSTIAGVLNAATYTVTRTMPDDNNPGSLRWCMNGANLNAGPDTIVFSIPGTGPQVIAPIVQLPVLTDQAGVLIDGLSQPGTWAGANPPSTANLLIVLDGTNAGASHGIWIFSSNNTIQGSRTGSGFRPGLIYHRITTSTATLSALTRPARLTWGTVGTSRACGQVSISSVRQVLPESLSTT